MPIVRSEYDYIRSAEVSAEDIDISVYDLCGRLGTDCEAVTCNAGEVVHFIYAEDVDATLPGNVIWTRRGGRMSLRVFEDVTKGQKLASNADGQIVASATAENAVPAGGDFAIALETGSAGDFVEVILTGE